MAEARHSLITAAGAGLLLLCLYGSPQLQAAGAADRPVFNNTNMSSALGVELEGENGGSYIANFIRILGGSSSGRTRNLNYMTGGESRVLDANALASAQAQRAPDRVIEKQREGEVVVQLRAFKDQDVEHAKEFARRIAKALHLATTRFLPGKPVPVHADIYLMPNGAAYSLARKVEWKTGRPLEIAIFIPAANTRLQPKVVTHELFHVLIALQTGTWRDSNKQRPHAANAFEEVAAEVFASCGALLADGYLLRPLSTNTYVVNDVTMKPPLTGEQLKLILTGLRTIDTKPQTGRPGTALGSLLGSTPVFHLFESGQERIELHSPQGDQLLEMCREFSPDPMKIESWLANLVQQ